MGTYILTWNPEKTDFEEADYDVIVERTREGEMVPSGWSCGNTKRIEAGDRIFFLRQGTGRGMVIPFDETKPDALAPPHQQHSGTPPRLKRPPDKAFKAWFTRDVLAVGTQKEIAETMTANGISATQGQVSRWLKDVENYRKAGGLLPTVDELNPDINTVAPDVIDMGVRRDGRTPRQRPRRDSDADSDDE